MKNITFTCGQKMRHREKIGGRIERKEARLMRPPIFLCRCNRQATKGLMGRKIIHTASGKNTSHAPPTKAVPLGPRSAGHRSVPWMK